MNKICILLSVQKTIIIKGTLTAFILRYTKSANMYFQLQRKRHIDCAIGLTEDVPSYISGTYVLFLGDRGKTEWRKSTEEHFTLFDTKKWLELLNWA